MQQIRLLTLLVVLFLATGCVTGPVEKGPVKTRDVQAMGEDEGRKLAEIATRNTAARYDSLMAQVWRVWKRGEARLKNKKPSGQLTPEQVQQWTNVVAAQLIDAAQARDDKLQTLNRKRTTELEHIIKLQNNQIAILAGVIKAWAVQGEISSGQFRAWLDVAQQGATFYIEQKNIKQLRKEAEEAAAAENKEGD